MALYVKEGPLGSGSWREITAGNLKFKKPQTTEWYFPSTVSVKIGGLGTGSWRDSGYRGYPAVPTGFVVNSWDYMQCEFQVEVLDLVALLSASYQVNP